MVTTVRVVLSGSGNVLLAGAPSVPLVSIRVVVGVVVVVDVVVSDNQEEKCN